MKIYIQHTEKRVHSLLPCSAWFWFIDWTILADTMNEWMPLVMYPILNDRDDLRNHERLAVTEKTCQLDHATFWNNNKFGALCLFSQGSLYVKTWNAIQRDKVELKCSIALWGYGYLRSCDRTGFLLTTFIFTMLPVTFVSACAFNFTRLIILSYENFLILNFT